MQVDNISRAVAAAHTPLVLLCMGIWLKDQKPRTVQVIRVPHKTSAYVYS